MSSDYEQDATGPRAHAHEGLALDAPAKASPEEGSPGYWWHTICAREADLKRAQDDEKRAREVSGEHLLHNGQPDARLLGEVAKAQALVSSLQDAIRQGTLKLIEAEEREKLGKKHAIRAEGEAHSKEYLEATARLQDHIEQMAATLIETFRAGSLLVRSISEAKKLVPPKGRVIAGDVREALGVAAYLADRVQTEIARRVGYELWPTAPEVPPQVQNCPLVDQHAGIVHNALNELVATLGLEE